jgi:iron-sulfur cluster protein
MTTHAHSATDSPRAVADKREKRALLAGIRLALSIESAAVRRNTQTFNRSRYAAVAALPDYDALKDRARAIKERSLQRLPELLATLEASIRRAGGHFYLAADAQDACRYIADVCRRAGVLLAVKGKSMTSEEIGLNHALELLGIEVVETDLAEFILQAADEQPSHIIAPAIHYDRERITALFRRVFRTDRPLDSGEELTAFARERLREKFLRADAGISGANLIAADSGTLVLVESEANIRMTSLLPPLYIACAGIEKIVPTREDLAPFLELLAASATGQPMSCYTSILSPPLLSAPVLDDGSPRPREFHLVLVDNGREKMARDPVLREALYCIRCSACLNSCANFQTVGGHAFGGETYSGGIGGAWEAGTRGLEYARFSELCTGCSRCVPQCPVRIDVPWLNSVLRRRLARHHAGMAPVLPEREPSGVPRDDRGTPLQKLFFARYDLLGKWGSRMAPLMNRLQDLPPSRILLEKLLGLDRRRHLPPIAGSPLIEACARLSPVLEASSAAPAGKRVVLFADIFTNYGTPARGLAALKVLRSLGLNVVVSETSPDGRAPLSQGMIAAAARHAQKTAALLARYLDEGRDIVVVEPSVLAMFRLDYRHLLEGPGGQALFEKLRARCFDAAEFVWNHLYDMRLHAAALFPAAHHPHGTRIFLHSHCQAKTIGSAAPVENLLRAAGFDVVSSQVECCGMAGSFGYKKEFYQLSMAVGADLFEQARRADAGGPPRILVAAGTSCQEQLQAGLGRRVFHPMEVLAEVVTPS